MKTAFSTYVSADHTLDDKSGDDDYVFRELDAWLYFYQMRDEARKALSCRI